MARFIKAANRHIEVFVSSVPGQIQTGEDWLETIRVELRRADAFLVLLSARSVLRPWIWFETAAAWHSKRPLYPLVLPGLTKSEVPMPLAAHQMLSLDLERDVEQLLADLDLVIPDIAKVVANIRTLSDGLISSQTEISEPDKSVGAT
jgi:hypothetical protein